MIYPDPCPNLLDKLLTVLAFGILSLVVVAVIVMLLDHWLGD